MAQDQEDFDEVVGRQFTCTTTGREHTVTAAYLPTFGTHNVGNVIDGYEACGVRCPDCGAVVHMIVDNQNGNYLYHVR